jgi:hypothetical protein
MESISFRLLVVLVTFFVGVFAVSVWLFENQDKFTQVSVNLPSTEEKQIELVPNYNPNEDYEVYSAILTSKKEKGEVIIIGEATVIGFIAEAKNLNKEISILTEDTIRDFDTKNEKSYKLQNNFSIENKVVLINEKAENNSSRRDINPRSLFIKYPEARAILTFSRVGFNTNRTQALVYFTSWCDPLCGSGDFIFLQKINGKWTVEREVRLWVS